MILAAELLRRLDSYLPTDEGERDSLARVRDLLRRARDPFTRNETDHVTASAVVARPDGSAFLLVHHRRLDRWLQPGGHVEPGDRSVLATALREAREETGITAFETPLDERVFDLDVHPIPALRDRPAHIHYDLRYLATTLSDSAPSASDEVFGARWFALADALGAGVDASLARALTKASRFLASR